MAAGGISNGDMIGFEEGLTWLPSHVLEEALFDYSKTHESSVKKDHHHFHNSHHHHHHHYRRGSLCRAENLPLNSRSNSRNHMKQRQQNNWLPNAAGMQAFFLASGQKKTSGTGVFLPSAGSCQPQKKPAVSPVLLPSRVVQALNLNVHSVGLQVSPRSDRQNNWKKKSKIEGSTRKCGEVNSNNSPEIFLPKDWTY